MESEPKPQSGQSHRSSGNYDFFTLKKGKKLLWILPPGVSINIKNDRSVISDNTVFSGIKNGDVKDIPSEQNLYIADPKGATIPFEVIVRVLD